MNTFLNTFFRIYLLSALLLMAGYGFSAKEQEKPQYKTFQVVHKTVIRPLFYNTTIEPIRKVNMTSEVEALVEERLFEYGLPVKKGQILLKLKSSKIEATYAEALKSYLQKKEAFFTSESTFFETEELYKLGFESKNKLEEGQRALNNANIGYLQQMYQLNEIMDQGEFNNTAITKLDISDVSAVDNALRVKHDKIIMKATRDGIALMPSGGRGESTKLEEGTQVKQGEVILIIGDLSGIALTVNVTEIDVREVKKGQKAFITGIAFPEFELEGEVRHIEQQAMEGGGGSGLPTFPVEIEVKDLTKEQQEAILVGMSVKIRLDIERQGAIEIPIKAVTEEAGKAVVYRLEEDGQLEKVVVSTSTTSFDSVVITKGLKAGDEIIIPN